MQILSYRVVSSTEFPLVRKVNKINELFTDTLFHYVSVKAQFEI